jgi:hypothetical protein
VSELDRVRKIALGFPEVNERLSHGEPCFFVRNQRPLCYFHDDHNGDGRISLWCPSPPGVQAEMVSAEPGRFFAPPTSSGGVFSGWLGVYLDTPDKVDPSLRCAECRSAIKAVVQYCVGCGRDIDWDKSRSAAEAFNDAQQERS